MAHADNSQGTFLSLDILLPQGLASMYTVWTRIYLHTWGYVIL